MKKKPTNDMGEKKNFDINWKRRKEANYLHWTRKKPVNQIQLAFRNHWITFSQIIKKYQLSKLKKKVLEVGCGRGSLSAYFSDAGYECTLNDSSKKAIQIAKKNFNKFNLAADFNIGDCRNLSFKDNSFDIIFSIGLLEHFKNPNDAIREQVRILKPGGIIISYIVPKFNSKVQERYKFFCDILISEHAKSETIRKQSIFRSRLGIKTYKKIYKTLNLKKIFSSGIYSLPMISHSYDFPFTLMRKETEKILVKYFIKILKSYNKKNPWLCSEQYGQAILISGQK